MKKSEYKKIIAGLKDENKELEERINRQYKLIQEYDLFVENVANSISDFQESRFSL